ncbi:YoaK family protein [Rhodanobacter sp. BL-MT-08]
MIRQLPRWAWFGGSLLACIAGSINTVGYLGFRHEAISHLTGTTTLLGIAVAGSDLGDGLHWLLVLLSFLLGAMLSGFIVQHHTLQLGRRYGVALLVESGLLLIAVPLLHARMDMGLYAASAACGLQNAMASTYSGTVLRTTHLSGTFTDLGIALGQLLRGLKADMLRLRLCLMLIGSFLAGSLLGGLAYRWLQEYTLLIPAALTGLTGLGYHVYVSRHQPES